jgi:hypothetical protein
LTAGLVAHYDFDDLANDPAASGPGLTVGGTGQTIAVPGGIEGGAVEFTGTTGNFLDTAIGFGGAGANQLGNSFTVSAWYNLDTDAASGASRFFVFEGRSGYDISYGLRDLAPTGNGFTDAQTYTDGIASDPNASYFDIHTQGTWQQVLMTYDSDGTTTTITTYIDGNSESTLSLATAELTSDGIHIGNARDGGSLNRAFDGKIDEFAAWNRVLDSTEIAEAYQLGLAGQAIPEPSIALLGGLGLLGLLRRRR